MAYKSLSEKYKFYMYRNSGNQKKKSEPEEDTFLRKISPLFKKKNGQKQPFLRTRKKLISSKVCESRLQPGQASPILLPFSLEKTEYTRWRRKIGKN